MLPLCGVSSPAIRRSSVVFPQPEGPVSAVIPLFGISSVSVWKTRLPP